MKRRGLSYIITLALVIAYNPASARYYSAAQLNADCKIALSDYKDYHEHKYVESHLETGNCMGYIMGIIEAHNKYREISYAQGKQMLANHSNRVFCLPANEKIEDVVQIVIKDLDNHPELQKYSATAILLDILLQRFPCKE